MNRNSKSHFSATDNRINMGRSRFNRNSWWKGTFNTGDLVPFYVDEVLPGDTFDMNASVMCRMSTPLVPVADNCYLDTYFFFCPSRLVWTHFKQFMGENNRNAWVSDIDFEIPQIEVATNGQDVYTVADYMGLPVVIPTGAYDDDADPETPPITPPQNDSIMVNALPFRAYQLIWNEWFRDQNLQDPVFISGDDSYSSAEENASHIKLRRVNRFHDYFSSALPQPQKGSAVLIPGFDGSVPIVTGSTNGYFGGSNSNPAPALRFLSATGNSVDTYDGYLGLNGSILRTTPSSSVGSFSGSSLIPSNLFVGTSAGVTIDALRTAFQVQKLLWRDGNCGSRYTEIIRSHFGVVSPDARLQRPEYLGGKRIPITVNQVIQQSAAANEPTPLGNTGAVSKTVDQFNGFTKSFTEHGYLIGVCCIRTDHTYQQGINRMWSRKDRFDFYFPELAHIGEQAILNKEIFTSNLDRGLDDQVFGYQEAWAEYRYRPSYVTGAFRSNNPGGSLDIWHYADYYPETPVLSAEWIEEPVENVERTLAVQNATEEHSQWLCDFYFDLKTTRPMPMYSVPGLVDHF